MKCKACKDGFYGMTCELGCPKYGLANIDMQHSCFPGCKDHSGVDIGEYMCGCHRFIVISVITPE